MKNQKLCFESVQALAELEYFRINEQGKLESATKNEGPIIDMHTHLGFTSGLAPRIDLSRRTQEMKHSFGETGMQVDLSIYSGVNLTRENRNGLFRDYAEAALLGRGAATTYTAPNLIDEMDRMGVRNSVSLAMDLPGSMKVSELHIRAAGGADRLIPFCGVSPRSLFWETFQ